MTGWKFPLASLAMSTAVGLGAASAQTAGTAGTDVTVIRGIGQDVAAPAGVSIFRGPGIPPAQQLPAPSPRDGTDGRIVAAGEDFWLFDTKSGRLIGCDLGRTFTVDTRRITCASRKLPR